LGIENRYEKYIDDNAELEQKRKKLDYNLTNLRNFYKVFLHEIRTPISTFSLAPSAIKRLFNAHSFTEQIRGSINRKLDDIQVLGERLGFIADTYYFDDLVRKQHPEKLSLLRDVVYPVINISREYLRKQFEVDVIVDNLSLESQLIYGDKKLLNIVFNTLLSNAGKYTQRSARPIRVYGRRDPNGRIFSLVVENYGIPIEDEERDRIFENGYQGHAAKDQKLGGMGIGLYLASEIMKYQEGGKILLTSCRDPVRFEVQIPEQARKDNV
jgi:signal transduction histidine kinase